MDHFSDDPMDDIMYSVQKRGRERERVSEFVIQNMDYFSDDPMDDIMYSVHRRRAAAR